MTTPSQSLKLIPITPDPQTIQITPRPIPRPANNLDQEINNLRGAMKLIYNRLEEIETLGDLAFHSATIARLSDSIVRALLAAQKLNAIDQETAELKAEIERIFRELGWSPQP